MEIGSRVGAVEKADGKTIYLFGFGLYAGAEVPPEEAEGFIPGIPNPKIVLDNGKVVFGCECLWGPEAKIKGMIGGREIVEVDIDESRRRKMCRTDEAMTFEYVRKFGSGGHILRVVFEGNSGVFIIHPTWNIGYLKQEI